MMKNFLPVIFMPLLMAFVLKSSDPINENSASEKKLKMIVVCPDSKSVVAGTEYHAKVLVYEVPSELPEILVNGRKIKVDENGVGDLTFKAFGSVYDSTGTSKQKFKIDVTGSKDKEQEIHVSEDYSVVKPVIHVKGGSTRTLFRDCGNYLNVEVPGLGNNYNPSFRAEGAMVIPGIYRGVVTVIPSGRKAKLIIATNGDVIGSEEFMVQEVPEPDIAVMTDSIEVNYKAGVKASELKTLRIRAIPDEFFRNSFPKDARYRVSEVTLNLLRKSEIVQTFSFSQEFLNLSEVKAEKGDILQLEINKIDRINFLNRKVDVRLRNPIVMIPLN